MTFTDQPTTCLDTTAVGVAQALVMQTTTKTGSMCGAAISSLRRSTTRQLVASSDECRR
jgi:hypothetical protein